MDKSRKRPPAVSPEDRENRLISLAMDTAEKQMMEGTASSQVITHFLKMGALREQLETEKLRKEIMLLKVKADAIEASKQNDQAYKEAMKAFALYTGRRTEEIIDDGEGYYDSDIYGID